MWVLFAWEQKIMFLSMASHIDSLRKQRLGATQKWSTSVWNLPAGRKGLPSATFIVFGTFPLELPKRLSSIHLPTGFPRNFSLTTNSQMLSLVWNVILPSTPNPWGKGGRKNPHGLGNGDGWHFRLRLFLDPSTRPACFNSLGCCEYTYWLRKRAF